jgi:23S rRNA (adenine2030-N6)-methyltransferase
VWYPVKERAPPDALARRLRQSGMGKILRVAFRVTAPPASTRLAACGLIVVNPPWTLAGELEVLLPELTAVLAGAGGGAHRVDWLAGEK